MKKFIIGLLCFIGLSAQSFAADLIWATGNDYLEQCGNLEGRPRNQQYACLAVASNLMQASMNMISSNEVDRDKYFEHYELEKVTADTACLQLESYIKICPELRTWTLPSLSNLAFRKNYPIIDSLRKKQSEHIKIIF